MLRSLTTVSFLAAAALGQSPFTIGNVVVVRVGDGTTTLSNASTATFLDEYSPAGTLVQSIPLPTTATGANQPLAISGTATSEGFLDVSANGLYLTLAGYAAAPGVPAIATTTSSTTPRVVARVDLAGLVDTSTTLTDGYDGVPTASSGGNIRAAVTIDGSAFWTSGTSSVISTAGVRYVQFGASTSLGLNAGGPGNTRVVGEYLGQLYTSSASTVFQGVCTVGTGLPTAPPQPITLLPGLPTATGPSAYDFFFADPSTLYVADDRSVANGGGIQKYTQSGGVWSLQYTLAGTAGCRGLTGRRVNGVTTLWATTGGALVTVDDTGAGAVVSTLASAPTSTQFRGVRVLERPTTLVRQPGACGVAGLGASGTGELGTEVSYGVIGALGFPFLGFGVTPLGVPFCNCTVLHDFIVMTPGPTYTLAIPNTPVLVNFALYVQGVDFLAPGGCPDPLFTLTDGYALTIQ